MGLGARHVDLAEVSRGVGIEKRPHARRQGEASHSLGARKGHPRPPASELPPQPLVSRPHVCVDNQVPATRVPIIYRSIFCSISRARHPHRPHSSSLAAPSSPVTDNMVFYPPACVPKLREEDVPDTVPICDFMFDEQYGRFPIAKSKDPYTCGLTGKTITAQQQKERVTHLARALSKEFGWEVNKGSEFDKVAGVFAFNTVGPFPPGHGRKLMCPGRPHDPQLGTAPPERRVVAGQRIVFRRRAPPPIDQLGGKGLVHGAVAAANRAGGCRESRPATEPNLHLRDAR